MPPGVSLDQPPPLPTNVSAPQSSLAGLSGGQPQGGASAGGTVQKTVIEKLMNAEKMLRDAAGVMPELAPVIDDVTSRLRAGAGQIIAQSSQPQGAAGGAPAMGGLVAGGAPPMAGS